MKTRIVIACLLTLLLALGTSPASIQASRLQLGEGKATPAPSAPLGTAFTYQGHLTDGGSLANGTYDFEFALYDALIAGTQVGSTVAVGDVTVSEGTFSVVLDFGSVFDGTALYLQVGVRAGNSSGVYTTLTPRQALTAAPYALFAANAASATNATNATNASAVPWTGISGMPPGFADGVDDEGWTLTGNAGTTPGANFLGTTDNAALELHVNSTRALRLEPNTDSPNVIGGYSGNGVTLGVYGATIGGGGQAGFINSVSGNYDTVSGGIHNTVNGDFGTVGGGTNNTAGLIATIGGGQKNSAGIGGTVGGGSDNTADSEATVGGGNFNTASGYVSTIGGGVANTADSHYTTVSGGVANTASHERATVGGGGNNTASGVYSTVPGGSEAHASNYGQWAYASGGFNDITGTAQASVYVLRQTTSNSGLWMSMFLDGYSQHLLIDDGRTLTFDILVVGRSDAAGGSESAGYYIWGVAENLGGVINVWASTITLNEEDTNWDAQAIYDGSSPALTVQVMGAGETIRWVATVRTVEVAW